MKKSRCEVVVSNLIESNDDLKPNCPKSNLLQVIFSAYDYKPRNLLIYDPSTGSGSRQRLQIIH